MDKAWARREIMAFVQRDCDPLDRPVSDSEFAKLNAVIAGSNNATAAPVSTRIAPSAKWVTLRAANPLAMAITAAREGQNGIPPCALDGFELGHEPPPLVAARAAAAAAALPAAAAALPAAAPDPAAASLPAAAASLPEPEELAGVLIVSDAQASAGGGEGGGGGEGEDVDQEGEEGEEGEESEEGEEGVEGEESEEVEEGDGDGRGRRMGLILACERELLAARERASRLRARLVASRERQRTALFVAAAAMAEVAWRDDSGAGCDMWDRLGDGYAAMARAQLRSVRPMDVAAWVDAGARAMGMETASLVRRLGGRDGDGLGGVDGYRNDGTVALRAIIFEAWERKAAVEGGGEGEEVDELDGSASDEMEE